MVTETSTTTGGSTRKLRRRLGWLGATLFTLAAVIGPGVGGALAAHTITLEPDDYSLGTGFGDPCGDALELKIDEKDLVAGTHTYVFGTTGISVELTTVFDGSEIDSVTVESITGGTADIYVHAGEGNTIHLVPGLVIDPDKGISFVLFCATVTTTTTTDETTTDETTTDETTTDETTTDETTTTVDETTTTTDETTTTVSATTTTVDETTTTVVVTTTTDVSGTTTTITLPPTSTIDPASGGNSGLISFGLLLLALGSLVVGLARPLASRKVEDR
jgi:hypothetical protein